MIKKLQQLLNNALAEHASELPQDREKSKLLAVASLMIEMIGVDGVEHQDEKRMLRKILLEQFAMDETAIAQLIAQAEQTQQQATDLYHFTAQINRQFSPEEKLELIEALWQIAYADGSIDDLEQHVIRKLARLLHVSHKDFIAAKIRVLEA